jgi:hypothetical protein
MLTVIHGLIAIVEGGNQYDGLALGFQLLDHISLVVCNDYWFIDTF